MSFLGPRTLRIHATIAAGLSILLVAVWASTNSDRFWPIDAALPLTALLAVHGWSVLLSRRPTIVSRFAGSRPLAIHAGALAAQWLYLLALWVEGGCGYFWPGWALIGFGLIAGVHVLQVLARSSNVANRAASRSGQRP